MYSMSTSMSYLYHILCNTLIFSMVYFRGSKYVDEEKGVTGILAFTERGRMVIANCPGIETVNESVEVVTEGQMKSCITKPYYYRGLMALLRTPLKLKFIYRIIQMLRIGNILKVKMHL